MSTCVKFKLIHKHNNHNNIQDKIQNLMTGGGQRQGKFIKNKIPDRHQWLTPVNPSHTEGRDQKMTTLASPGK
jgi:hypothetical protein